MSDKVIDLEQLRETALAVQKIISAVVKAAEDAVSEIERKKQDGLSGEENQVLSFDSDGTPVAVKMLNEMLPVVDVEHGGTGATSIDKMLHDFTGSLEQIVLGSTSMGTGNDFMVRESKSMRAVSIDELRTAMIGASKPIVVSNNDYTVPRARAISLHTTMPTTGLVNGCLYGIYV